MKFTSLTLLTTALMMAGVSSAQDYIVSSQPYPPNGSSAEFNQGDEAAMPADRIAADVVTQYNPRTGEPELVAPTFDPFELDADLAASVNLRSTDQVRDLNNEPFSDGALLDINLYYSAGDERGFGRTRDAFFLDGEPVPIILRDSRELECSSRVTETVYHSDRYYSPGYGGLYRSPPVYLGLYFGGRGWHGRGYDRWRRHDNRYRYRDHYRDRGRNRYRNRDRYRDWDRNDGRRRDRDNDRVRNRDRDRSVPPTPRTRDRSPRVDRNTAPPVRYRDRNSSGDAIREWNNQEQRLRNRREDRPRQPRRERSNDVEFDSTITAPRPRSERRQNRRNETRRNETRREQTPVVRSSPPPPDRPQPRATTPQPRVQTPPRAQPAPPRRSTPRQPSERRARQLDREAATDTLERLDMFPNGRGDSYVISSERDCAREDRLALFIPQERLDAARFDGMTIIIRDVTYDPRSGQTTVYDERPLYVPANYIEGFRIARDR